MARLAFISLAGFALAGSAAFAQSIPSYAVSSVAPGRDAQGRISGTVRIQPPRTVLDLIAGRPYSADEVQRAEQVLANGTRIVQTRPVYKIFRDSKGRSRLERPVDDSNNAAPSQLLVELNDPAAGVYYALDTDHKVAYSVHYTRAQFQRITPPLPLPLQPSATPPTVESLPTRVIDGLAAEGRRATTVIPAGAAGNDRPLNLVQEAWISSDLWTQVLFTRSDPRTGEFTLQLTNIKREEPDSSLFVPPPDYRVLEVPSGFSFSFGAFQVLGGLDPSDITTPPVAITRTDPDYTDDARQAKISGTVLVTAMIGVDGIPSDIRVTKSLDPGLDRKAMEAVAKWRFRPATRNGQAVRAPVTIELTFKVR